MGELEDTLLLLPNEEIWTSAEEHNTEKIEADLLMGHEGLDLSLGLHRAL